MKIRYPHKIRIANGYYRYVWESDNRSWGRVSKVSLRKNSRWMAIRSFPSSVHEAPTRRKAVMKAAAHG